MGKPRKVCAVLALLGCCGFAHAARYNDPMIITLDGRHYVTYTAPLVVSVAERLVVAPEAGMSLCRRSNSEPLASGPFEIIYTPEAHFVQAATMSFRFNPTRVVLQTQTGDVICDGEALGYQTGFDRVFRDNLEAFD